MKKRIISLLMCLTLLLSVLSVGVVTAGAKTTDREVPTSFSEPYIYVTSDKNGVYVNAVHPEDMQRFLTYSSCWWGDAEGGSTDNDYYWTEYGDGLRFDVDVQYDWRIPGTDWHYTTEWDTENYFDNPNYDDFDIWSDITGCYYRAIHNSQSYNAEEGDKFYALKDYFDEYYDGWDYYYLFDQSKSLEFRARYRVRVESNYYPVEEQEDTTNFIYSDWCEPVSYGASNDASAQLPDSLPTPVMEESYIETGTGEYGANMIWFRAFTPFDMAYLTELRLDIEEISVKSVYYQNIVIEASLDGENWTQVQKHNLASREYYVDTMDIWYKLIRDPEVTNAWRDFEWEEQEVYLRTKYICDVEAYNYSGEEVTTDWFEMESNYSEVVKITVPEVKQYHITMDYTNYGAEDYSTNSFIRTENERIGWIALYPREGFWVQRVVVNGEVMFDLEDESTYELLDWEYQEQMKRNYFKFKDDAYAWDDLTISVTYGGEAPTKHNLTYSIGEENTGRGYANVYAKGVNTDLDYEGDIAAINEGMEPTLTVRASKGSVIKSVTLDGRTLNVPKNATEYEYEMSAVTAPMTLVVEFEEVSFSVYGSRNGNGTITYEAPDYYEDAGEYINKGDSITFNMQAEEGFEILRVTVDGEDVDLSTLGKTGNEKFTTASYTFENVQESHRIYVDFSTPDTQYVTLTVKYNSEYGTCNGGDLTETVVKGGSCGISIVPKTGYYVARIIDGDTEITNFTGDSYYVRNLNENRTVEIVFEQVEIPSLLGDVNCDVKVNIKDVTLIQKSVAGLAELTEKGEFLADTDLSGGINVKDATAIQKFIAGIETGYPIGQPV